MAGGHGQQFGRRAEDALEAVSGLQQHPGAVLAAQAQGKRLVPGAGGGAGAFGGGGRLAGRGQGGLGLREPVLGLLVPFGEFRVVGVEAVNLGLEGFVLLLRGDRTLLCLVAGGGQAVDLGLRGGGTGAGGADLAAEPGEALAAVGDGAGCVLQAAFLGGQLAFQFGAVGDGVVEGALRGLQGRLQFGLLLADAGGLALQVLGVAAAPLLQGGLGGALHAGVGEGDRAADAFGELGQLVPGLLGALEARAELPYLVLQEGLALERLLQVLLGGFLAGLQRGLVGDLGVEGLTEPYEIVGEEAEAGVAQVGLDDGGAAGDGGLPGRGV
ncbi:hypothetical protein GCM10020256_20300 [Streptomyces thermocoprophilus]